MPPDSMGVWQRFYFPVYTGRFPETSGYVKSGKSALAWRFSEISRYVNLKKVLYLEILKEIPKTSRYVKK